MHINVEYKNGRSVHVDSDAVVKLVREQGPMTSGEVQFAYSWPDIAFAERALRMVDTITSALAENGGYWTAVIG